MYYNKYIFTIIFLTKYLRKRFKDILSGKEYFYLGFSVFEHYTQRFSEIITNVPYMFRIDLINL